MKKSLLLFTSLLAIGASAQTPVKIAKIDPNIANHMEKYEKRNMVGNEIDINQRANHNFVQSAANSLNGQTIGKTSYDLQSNASVQNRLISYPNGALSATFTYSNSLSLASPDRGTGYVYRGANGWGASPTQRIESERTGWPTQYYTNSGREGVICHNVVSDGITQNRRMTPGAGAWSEDLLITDPSLIMLWPRAVSGGSNGNTIHMIALTAPTANDGSLYQGLNGALLYHRSTDGGITWEQPRLLPGMGSGNQPSYSGDSYAIHARGNTVAFAVFNTYNPSFLMKSTDNGVTWTKTIFFETGLSNYDPAAAGSISDATGNGVADTILSTDNGGAILIDHNGNAHIWYGILRYLDQDPAAEGESSYFPVTDGIEYWNENIQTSFLVASSPDINGDGTIGIVGNAAAGVARYFLSMTCMPHASIDANGTIYLTYSTHMETLADGARNYRHVFIKKSEDGGCTWSEGIDLTPASNFSECVFASMDREVTDSIRLIFQEDNAPGLAVRGEEHPFGDNFIVYKAVHPSALSTTSEFCHTDLRIAQGTPEFCQGDSVLITVETCGTGFLWNTGETTPAIWVKNYQTYSCDITTDCGVRTESIEFVQPSTGALPPFQITASKNELCPGDSTVVTVSGVSIGSIGGFNWSTGDTSRTINVIQGATPANLSVTVTNCQGTGNNSITINEPSSVAAIIDGETKFCPGGQTTLEAEAVSIGSYNWTFGGLPYSTDRIINVTQAGTYNLEVINCAGTASSSVDVVIDSVPTLEIIAIGNLSICEGENLTLRATGGSNIQWFKDGSPVPGANTETIGISNVSQSGTYYVTAENDCGISGQSADVIVEVQATPEIPTLTINSNNTVTAVSNGAASFIWFLNNNQSGQTGATFNIPQGFTSPSVRAKAVSSAGCESDFSQTVVNVGEIMNANGLKIYPNPASSFLFVELTNRINDNIQVQISDLTGKLVAVTNIIGDRQTIDVSGLNKGLYFVTIIAGETKSVNKVIIH